MRLTFRSKLLLIVGTALLTLLLMLGGSAWIGAIQAQRLADVEGRLVPKLEVGPRLDAEFERLSRGMQDAVASQDPAALAATLDQKAKLFELIDGAGGGLEPSAAAAMRWAIQDYYESAHDVSRRMIAGEAGEALIQDASRMQERQAKAHDLIKKATALDRGEIARTFGAVREANRSADRFRIAIGVLGIALVTFLSLWVSRGMFEVVANLSSGFARFAQGAFEHRIAVTSGDELGTVSKEANQMAATLGKHAAERAHNDWLRGGQAGLSDELRGELEPGAVAQRALSFLAQRVDALAAALYLEEEDGRLLLRGRYAAGLSDGSSAGFGESFREGEGLVGQAFASGELLVLEDPPAGYLKVRSGLGECEPRALVLAPLIHFGRKVGVLEFALLKPASDATRELLLSIRPTLVIALEAARSAAALRQLLTQTQTLAEQLSAQEEELRMNNQELQSQQEELRRANEELEEQRHALREQNEELELARVGLQQKAEELAQVSSYKSQFLANMSHELRTPLNSMLLLSHLLAENESGNLSAKQVEHMKTIHGAGKDLLALINQVLDLSKIEAGKQEIALESVPLENFISHARRTFEPLAAERGLSFLCQLEPGLPNALTTDRQRLERVLINLLSNAIKFTERGSVTLRIARPSPGLSLSRSELSRGSLAFSVTDTGVGIAPEAQQRVFAPFEQVESQAHRRYAGTGLGLAIARESVGLLGGELLLESEVGKGSTFTCVLPERAALAAKPAAAAERVAPQRIADDRSSLEPQGTHLLLIEDDVVLVEQLVDIIHARRLKVVVAATAKEGLELARQSRPLGIILDVKLPDIDGWTVMELLKRDPLTRSVPVHFVSGVDAPQRGLALGAVGYLVKPASHAELAGVVRALAPARHGSQRILVVDDDVDEGDTIVTLLSQEQFEAERVVSAEAALEALRQGNFGCMILDLGLPEMDGLGLLEKLRQSPELGSPRVVIHTGRALTKLETRQLEAYSEAVVLKDDSSAQRLLEEVRLFVRYVRESLPKEPHALPTKPASDLSLEGVTLLLAEDDMRTVYALSALLRGKGAHVIVAETGREALQALDTNPSIRGVLMDVMMPEMDGYEAMRRLRQDPRFATVPVLALTAKAMKGERERCIEAGASDYLSKPIDSDKLLATLDGMLGGKRSNGAH